MTTQRNLRVLIADEDRDALSQLGEVLTGLGHEVTPFVVSVPRPSSSSVPRIPTSRSSWCTTMMSMPSR